MKYLLSFFILIFVSIPFLSPMCNANSIFSNSTTEIPYCKGNDCGLEKGLEAVKGVDAVEKDKKASVYIQGVVKYILRFLALIATIIIIYAGFNLLTGIGDEEKAKKTKNIIIYAIVGLVIIFLAGPIIEFVLKIFN